VDKQTEEIKLKPIGFVRNEIKQPPAPSSEWWRDTISEMVIDESLTEALDGLEEFSHIIVLFWMNRGKMTEVPLKVHPMARQELPLTGLFTTRSPIRPNRIGITTVHLLQRQGNTLRVKGLDALDGTPVLDIKPYLPGYDTATDARVPSWRTGQSTRRQSDH